jgi:acetyl-CoA carboxylase biotin carboxyl carrier protein
MAQRKSTRNGQRRPSATRPARETAERPPAPKAEKRSGEGLYDLRAVEDLARVVRDFDIAELELELGGNKLRLRRGPSGYSSEQGERPAQTRALAAPVQARLAEHAASPPPPAPAAAAPVVAPVAPVVDDGALFVTSPFVGTFYRAPSPDAASFVEVGTVVKKGQPLCIVEAMKLMNEIEAEHDGKIVAILAQNGQPVEYGEALFKLGPA